jgi:DNA ligase-1
MFGPTIYKRDATGKIRIWRYEVDNNCWRTYAGLMGGELVVSGWTTCTPKSQPTAQEQALFEAKAEHQKKIDRDYRSSLEDVDRPRASVVKPMLAHKFEGWVAGWQNVYSQPKLDGIRCIATRDGLWTRQSKPIISCLHIEEALRPFFAENPDHVFDGELYNHDLKDDFNAITSVVKKLKPTEEDKAESARLIQYHIYDVPSHGGTFGERYHSLEFTHLDDSCFIHFVETNLAFDKHQLDADYEVYINDGYEGQIVRLNGRYEQKRSKLLLKRKEFQDEEFPISRVIEGNGNWAGYAKAIEFILPDDKRLENGDRPKAGIRGSQEMMKKLLDGPAPDSVTVRFFAYTPAGIPRFPVATAFHHGERL